jgi:DNA-binding transcriptional ArsR family regulator
MANLDAVFHCLSDGTRRAVIAQLAAEPASVLALASAHDMALPSFLKHIKVLEAGGWIETEKTGRVRTCRLRPETAKTAQAWLDQQRKLWEARFDALDTIVETMKRKEKADGRRRKR